ncbi:MAG TPA: hypothetical protein VJ482_13920 [Acidimicrobiia bacterium]|nr:hypothetical protein [Acidimicrobiia bacterium]
MSEQVIRVTYATLSADNDDLHAAYDEGIVAAGISSAPSIRSTSTAARTRAMGCVRCALPSTGISSSVVSPRRLPATSTSRPT